LKFFFFLFAATLACAQPRQIAITIDDLPRGGDKSGNHDLADTIAMTAKLTSALRGIPVTVFVNPGQARQLGDAGLAALLELWRKQGAEIGNHTFSHPDLNKIPLSEYQADILRAEPAIRAARGGSQSRYFRHPFLHTGPTEATKRGLADFLQEHKYQPAPVTIDTSDWMFARVYTSSQWPQRVRDEYIRYMDSHAGFFEQRTLEVVGRDIPQILLIHANQLNADSMPELLAMFRKRGYKFISLENALKDPAYKLPDGYTGANGVSWLHRWAIAKGLPVKMEPDEPKWILDSFQRR
jgi:peptidoglycan/xylan/chitin deacetylase (PgdA/CDA1 family)